jgi:hypothetical protein
MSQREDAAGASIPPPAIALFALLTFMVWGSHAFSRTLFQDDVQTLFRVFSDPEGLASGALTLFGGTVTRSLLGVPSAIALLTPWPRAVLQALYGLGWLATACVAYLLARRLYGHGPAPLLAGAFTATATADYLTNSLVTLPAALAQLACFAALAGLLRYVQDGAATSLVLACGLAQLSLFTCEYAVPAVALAPALLLTAATDRRRVAVASAAWYATSVPYLWFLLEFLDDPTGYAAVAVQPAPIVTRALAAGRLFLHHFTPWTWVARQQWFADPGSTIPAPMAVGFAILGALAFLLVARRGDRIEPSPLRWRVPLVCLLVCFAAGAPFATVQLGHLFARTHLNSRLFAALALAGLLQRRATATRVAGAALVALGVLGGVERQDYFTAYSTRHRAELRSILAAVPGLAPDAALVLRTPAHRYFLATEVPYLARAWMTLLYQDPSVECRVAVWALPGATCEERDGTLVCRGEISPRCVPAHLPREQRLRRDRAVVLDYDPESNTFSRREPPRRETVVPRAPSQLAVSLAGASRLAR